MTEACWLLRHPLGKVLKEGTISVLFGSWELLHLLSVDLVMLESVGNVELEEPCAKREISDGKTVANEEFTIASF